MKVLQLIEEVERCVPAGAPAGTRWTSEATVVTLHGALRVAAAARIDAHGRRREQYWCQGVRVERPVLLRLTCPETECPHAVQVHAQWLAFHGAGDGNKPREPPRPRPLMEETAVVLGHSRFVARPARFPCFTPCPHGAHPPMTIEKTGFDLFEEGACLGGGVARVDGVTRPRIPTVRAAEAYVLARHLESLAAVRAASDSSRAGPGPGPEAG